MHYIFWLLVAGFELYNINGWLLRLGALRRLIINTPLRIQIPFH